MLRTRKQMRRQGFRTLLVSAAMLVGVGLTGCGGGGDSDPAVVVAEADGTGRPTVAEAELMLEDLQACYEEAGVEANIYNEDRGDFYEGEGDEESLEVGIIFNAEVGVEVESGAVAQNYDGNFYEIEDRCLLIVAELKQIGSESPEQIAKQDEIRLKKQKCYADNGIVATIGERGGLYIDDQQVGYDEEIFREAQEECREENLDLGD